MEHYRIYLKMHAKHDVNFKRLNIYQDSRLMCMTFYPVFQYDAVRHFPLILSKLMLDALLCRFHNTKKKNRRSVLRCMTILIINR